MIRKVGQASAWGALGKTSDLAGFTKAHFDQCPASLLLMGLGFHRHDVIGGSSLVMRNGMRNVLQSHMIA